MVLKGAGGLAWGLLLLAGTGSPAEAQDVKPRKDIDLVPAGELGDYLHAFQILKDRPANRMDSLRAFQRLHNGGALPNGKQGGCEHESEEFLTWHRHLLHEFERALQAADPPRTRNVTLPYWDFTKRPTGARYPRVFEDRASVLWHDNRLRPDGTNDLLIRQLEGERAVRMAPERMRRLRELRTFREFGGAPKAEQQDIGALETRPHNWIHNPYTRGDMFQDTTAAVDPIFWSFHAYVDLLFDEWQREHGAFVGAPAHLLPSDLDRRYDHFDQPKPVRELLKVDDLGYRYERPPAPSGPPIPLRELGAEARAGPATLTFGLKLAGAEKKPAAPRRGGAKLRLSGVSVPFAGSWEAAFFVHPKSVQARPLDPAFQREYLSDYYVRWKGEHRAGHGHERGPRDITVEFLDRLRAAADRAAEGEWVVTVHFRPLEADAGKVAADLKGRPTYREMTVIPPGE